MIHIKKKILVIFFISIFLSVIIYKCFYHNDNQVLLITDMVNDIAAKDNMIIYKYDSIAYKELMNNIKKNDYKIIKSKNMYLNQYISSSNEIIISINNHEYFNKCKKSDKILDNYDDILSLNINDLYLILKRITNAKITIIGNYCKNKNHIQNIKIPFKSIDYYKNTKEI